MRRLARPLERAGRVEHGVSIESGRLQAAAEQLRELLVILDDEHRSVRADANQSCTSTSQCPMSA
jgi:hypothetical protein